MSPSMAQMKLLAAESATTRLARQIADLALHNISPSIELAEAYAKAKLEEQNG